VISAGFASSVALKLTCITMYYMRQILNISLPIEMVQEIKREVKKQKFSSVSEFIRATIRAYNHEIGWRRIQRSEKDFAEGRYHELKSFKDLQN